MRRVYVCEGAHWFLPCLVCDRSSGTFLLMRGRHWAWGWSTSPCTPPLSHLPPSFPFLSPFHQAPRGEGHLVKGSRWRRTAAAMCGGPGPAQSSASARWSTISPVVRKTSVCRSSIFLPLLLLISLRPRQVIVRQVSRWHSHLQKLLPLTLRRAKTQFDLGAKFRVNKMFVLWRKL